MGRIEIEIEDKLVFELECNECEHELDAEVITEWNGTSLGTVRKVRVGPCKDCMRENEAEFEEKKEELDARIEELEAELAEQKKLVEEKEGAVLALTETVGWHERTMQRVMEALHSGTTNQTCSAPVKMARQIIATARRLKEIGAVG